MLHVLASIALVAWTKHAGYKESAYDAYDGGPGPLPPSPSPTPTINLMTESMLGDFEEENWSGYACSFLDWASCVNSTSTCDSPSSTCGRCVSTASNQSITCHHSGDGQLQFHFPPGGIFPVTQQFTLPPNTAIIGTANPNAADQARQQIDVHGQTWFVVPKSAALCGDDPMCRDSTSKAPTACSGDPTTRRQGFLMSSHTSLQDLNFQGADLGRADIEGTLCGPGAIELPGCLSGDACSAWGGGRTMGEGVVNDVLVRNVRLSDAVKRAEIWQMHGDCSTGEALDADGHHVRAHQVSVWVAKLPDAEVSSHSNIRIDNLVSMNSRADGFNVHGSTQGLTLSNSHLENTGDDCIGVWSAGIEDMRIVNVTAKNCAVTAGAHTNWGSCMGTYAFKSLSVDRLDCFDPFLNTTGCNPRTHYTAMHINSGFAQDCMPLDASLALSRITYSASVHPQTPLDRPKCGNCVSCCGCSDAGYLNLTVHYLDNSVADGACERDNAGC